MTFKPVWVHQAKDADWEKSLLDAYRSCPGFAVAYDNAKNHGLNEVETIRYVALCLVEVLRGTHAEMELALAVAQPVLVISRDPLVPESYRKCTYCGHLAGSDSCQRTHP